MIIHKNLAAGEWFKLSLIEQLANVGMDAQRAIRWKKKGNKKYSKNAFYRVLELLDFIVADPKNNNRLKEVLRVRECFTDYFLYENQYNFTDQFWQKYFLSFNYAAALKRGL